MTCATCNQNCGNGHSSVAPPNNADPIYVALCRTLCEVRRDFCRDPDRYRNTTQAAEGERRAQADTDGRLRRAMDSRSDMPRVNAEVNRQRYVRYDNLNRIPNVDRTPVSPDTIRRHLDNIESQIRRRGAQILATRAGRAAARSWLKLVPVLNVISTAYDVYDIGSAGMEIYQQIQQARQQFSGDVYRVRPDVAIVGENGQLQGIYDFKFDGDSPAPGQRELYDRALQDSRSANQSSHFLDSSEESCNCDGPPNIRRAGAIG